ncbi:hypothetical protein J2X65_003145 [Ancylobacter sp. 3268]|nr:hypothetical protein [Ancylobacter sp. 3268]
MAIDAFAQRSGVPAEEFDDFHRLLRAMDDVWLVHIGEKLKAASRKRE